MKFILWQQQLVRESVDSTWMLQFDREVLVEGPSLEWCQTMFLNGTIDVSPFRKILNLNIMPYEEWVKGQNEWAQRDLRAAHAASEQMNEKGFVNYPANSPTPWCEWQGQRVPAV